MSPFPFGHSHPQRKSTATLGARGLSVQASLSAANHTTPWIVFWRKGIRSTHVTHESCSTCVTHGQVRHVEPRSNLVFLRSILQALDFWLEMALMINVHSVLCPVAYIIFIRDLVKEKFWGKVTCKIHRNDLWICLAGYKYNFISRERLFWIECPFPIDFPIPPWELEAFHMVMLSRSIVK